MEIEIVPYHSSWKTEFLESGRRTRGALGDAAARIYHIGSLIQVDWLYSSSR
ncbi:hypothetical protein [Paenibacillus sp. S-12]|uniref:hypothetical protein n=1 Tax=Paenibacillus sp. S-12 TaxID=3031371 RepID=UPI0025A07178|nr:hypothetical protein [Paenibacillus sp. S-12]